MEKKRDCDSDSAGSLKDFIDDDDGTSSNDSTSNKDSNKDSDIEIIPEPKSRSHTPGTITTIFESVKYIQNK